MEWALARIEKVLSEPAEQRAAAGEQAGGQAGGK